MHRKGGSLPERLGRLVIGLLLLIAPWMFGSTEEWAWTILQCLTALAALLAVFSPQRAWNWWWAIPMAALLVYLAAQMRNPSHAFWNNELAPMPHNASLPYTVDMLTTCQTFVKLLTYAGLFWAVRVLFTQRHHAWALLTVLAVSGFLLALVGIVQKQAGSHHLLGLCKPENPHFMFGPFVNRNNFTSYVNILIPAALAVAHHRRHAAQTQGARSHPGILFVFMALLMVLAVIMTTSRAGTVLCVVVLLAWGITELLHVIRGGGEARRLFLMVVLAAVALMGGLFWLGTKPIEKRLAEIRDIPGELAATGGRGAVYKATFKMFFDHWLYGTGAGTFSMTYPYYSTERMDWFRRYAHNDWLQYLAELGTVGTALLAALGIGVLRAQLKVRNTTGTFDWLGAALTIGLGGVALHALVDFPMHIPSIAVLVVAFAGLLTIPGVRRHHENHGTV
jgi:O-antigen ligase